MRQRLRLTPRPFMTLALMLSWLALNQTLALGHVLLGAVLGFVIAHFASPAFPGGTRPRVRVAIRLTGVVLLDIVVANLQVAVRILGPQDRLKPAFVWVPLDVHRPESITLLASIITLTPGTLSAELSNDRCHLLVHGLDVPDADELVATIKQRYERPIQELLE